MRLLISKKKQDSEHQFGLGHLWYDREGTTTANATREFLGFETFAADNEWLRHCKGREFGPDRTIIALAPAGNSIITGVKASLDADLADYNHTTQVFNTRKEIFDVLSAGSYEKDGNAGI